MQPDEQPPLLEITGIIQNGLFNCPMSKGWLSMYNPELPPEAEVTVTIREARPARTLESGQVWVDKEGRTYFVCTAYGEHVRYVLFFRGSFVESKSTYVTHWPKSASLVFNIFNEIS